MPRRTSYRPGTPNWVDLQTPDQRGAKEFYGQLFGWDFDDQRIPDGGVYSMAVRNGGVVGAIATQSPELAAQGVPPMWNTYIAVDDVDAATAEVEPAGGTVLMAPFDVMDAGRMAFVADPAGAAVALWQANQHIGATVVNEPGAVIWNELLTHDVDAVLPFYARVVGLSSETRDMGGDDPYTTFKAGDDTVAGTMRPPREDIANHWHVYFAVEDVAATVERATALDGELLAGPFTTPIGPMAALRDPQGGTFSVFQLTTPPA